MVHNWSIQNDGTIKHASGTILKLTDNEQRDLGRAILDASRLDAVRKLYFKELNDMKKQLK